MELRLSWKRLACVTAILVGMSSIAQGQITTGTVTGTVKDAQGGVIPGATVEMFSEARGTAVPSVVTGASGDYIFVNIQPDTYRLQISLSGFKTAVRTGVAVSPGDRLVLPAITIQVGTNETVTVTAEQSAIQSQSGERSFTVNPESVANLPTLSRSFTALAGIAPGVTFDNNQTPTRIGGGGSTNIMLDGVSANDTGSNRPLVQMNVESIAEVKVLTSGYQAEFGRSSGVQVTAVTKSGTNRFSGSVYDVVRNSDWYAISKVQALNGDPKTVVKEKDWGYSLGGPIGKPGGSNKLFFFYAQEFEPRKAGGDVQRFRVPTAAERAGDYSATLDQNGKLYNLIKDPASSSPCTAADNSGCFADGGTLGKIPANRLYQPGLNVLNLYPMPTLNGAAAAGLAYNLEVTRPTEKAGAYQPAIRVDYQPSPALRGTFKYSGWGQSNQVFNGLIPGFDDAKQYKPVIVSYAATVNYTVNQTTFLEGTFGHSQNELTGCALGQSGTGPVFCRQAIAMSPSANRVTAGVNGLPTLFDPATAWALDPSYYAYKALSSIAPPFFVNGQILRTPDFTWATTRLTNAPPNVPFAGYLNLNGTYDLSVSLTNVRGRHTFKGGYFQTHSLKIQQPNGQNAVFGTYSFAGSSNNALDTTYPFANAAVGVIESLTQRSSYIEANMVYWNREGFIQDNWKMSNNLTLDFGVRLVNQQPQYDSRLYSSNFLPEKWVQGASPALYISACASGQTCSGTNIRAKNPNTGEVLGFGSSVLIGTRVLGSGNFTNGILQAGKGLENTAYLWPTVGVAPRFGAAYDVTGQQKLVLRGGVGLYFDRPSGNAILSQVANPPALSAATLQFANLTSLGGALQPSAVPALGVFEHKMNLPSSTQWNVGVQMALPWSSSLDLSYVGQHAWNQLQGININAVDFGTAYLSAFTDPTKAASTTPGGQAYTQDALLRTFRGYGDITQQQDYGWNTFHSIQASFQRRFRGGISFGFNETLQLKNVSQTAARLEHAADGSIHFRADQAKADALLQTDPIRHTLKGNFVWDLPDLKATEGMMKVVGYALNDWQLSGIWSGTTAAPYTVTFSTNGYTNLQATGSPSFGARIALTGVDPGSGCSSDPLRQFNTAAFTGPEANSVGLESSPNVVKGCFQSVFDTAIARNVRLGGRRTIQIRLDVFNLLNQAIVTGRVTQMGIDSYATRATANNLPFDASGALIASKSLPKNAGFGVANTYQSPRTTQLQVRFGF